MFTRLMAAVVGLVLAVSNVAAFAATPYDGKWSLSINSNDARAVCSGFLENSNIVVSNGRISGTISHDEAGYLQLSGSIGDAGKFKGVEANSSMAFVSLTGKLRDMTGSGR